MFVDRGLFGGAITAQTAPDLIDASDIRQVPDTQEVFMYPNSNVSVILEILQKVEPSQLDEAIRFHFDSLAHDNSAVSSTVESVNVSVVPNSTAEITPSATVLKGVQMVPKFNRSTADKVIIYMALFRVLSKGIDVVLTFNVPVEATDGGGVDDKGVGQAEADFNTFAQSLSIVDFGLFA